MKFVLFTDNHFCQYSSVVRSRGEVYSQRLENQIKSINWVEGLADEVGAEAVICLGDFFDKPQLNAEELSALEEIKWSDRRHIFLCGNHEMGTHDLGSTLLESLIISSSAKP